MAVLIPALGNCAGRMMSGERRFAERLEKKLEDDYLLWWDVPIGPKQTFTECVVLPALNSMFQHHGIKGRNAVRVHRLNFRRSKFLNAQKYALLYVPHMCLARL